jgi:hypothetical protein
MPEDIEQQLVTYDRMKEQIEREVAAFAKGRGLVVEIEPPVFSCEKGVTMVAFPLPVLDGEMLAHLVIVVKNHLANVRIHAFDEGYYALQALNKNLFKTENILDNLKLEFLGLSANFRLQASKKGNFSQEEVALVGELFKTAYSGVKDDPSARLRRLGASLYTDTGGLDWSYIAGYEEVKRKIRESIILPLKNPEIYDSIARLTRRTFESNRPRAILFEGSPGVGKTTIARIIAGEVNVPLVYVPIESIMSKWYGQSSQNLAQIFDACEDLGGSILFLDEIDSLAGSRDQNMFEATRRVLSVLLRRLDGIDAVESTITIGATNRKNDLDNALISRFDQSIHFPMPNETERAAIFRNYASHLSDTDLACLGTAAEGFSGRNIRDLCEYTERRWARKLIIKGLPASVPSYEYYRHAVAVWKSER